jgi:sporulation protein YlmC with PRC-barrel domain
MNFIRQSKLIGAVIGLSLVAGAWSSVGDPPHAWLASDLIGMKVVSQEGESLGKIADVVVHPGGETSYAVLAFGGWLGMGDKLFAMPWTVLRAVEPDTAKEDSERSLVLPLDKERLKLAPGFDKKSWPITANANWTKDIDAFYLGSTNPNSRNPAEAVLRASVITWRATELRGANVQAADGKKLGDIKELVIDTNGRVSYVALSVGGFLGLGDRLVAVPWDSLMFSLGGDTGDEKRISLASTKEQLGKAPQFNGDEEHRTEMCTPAWITHVHKYFSCPPYWEKADTTVGLLGSGI